MSPLVLSRFGMLWRRQMKYNRVVIYINVWHWWHLLNRANLSMRNYWTTMQIEVYRWKKWQRIYFLVEELPIPIIGSIPNLEDRLVRLLRNNQANSTLCFRYNDLCELDTVQLNIIAEKKGREWFSLSLLQLDYSQILSILGVIFGHVEYEIQSMVRIAINLI